MNKEEYLNAMSVLDEKIETIKKEKSLLSETYIKDNIGFPIGSKVKVEYADNSRPTEFGFVTAYHVSLSGFVRPDIVKIKKNGSPSKIELFVEFWRHPTITLAK